MGEPSFPTIESVDHKLRNEINLKLALLLRKGIPLGDIVDMLDAKEFLTYIQVKKGQASVAHFSVDKFVKQRTIESRKISLPDDYTKLAEVILPPSEMEIATGSGNGFKEAGVIPRSALLMETLAELGLKYSVVEGENDPKMMRKLSYLIFILPSIEKLVLVNNEEGNATFIIHKAKQEEWKEYMNKTKEELSTMPYDLLSVVKYPDKNKEGHANKWKAEIRSLVVNGARLLEIKPENITSNEEMGYAPEGWMVACSIAKSLGANNYTIERYAEKYKSEKPEWFRAYKTKFRKVGSVSEYYSPELVEKIKKDYLSIESLPERWVVTWSLANSLNIASETVKKEVEEYRSLHPGWLKVYRKKGGAITEYISPELAKIISEKHEIQSAPEGWMTAHTTADAINVTFSAVKNEAEKFRTKNPEWFKIFRNMQNRVKEHYSPELVKVIRDKYKGTPFASDGWITFNVLAKQIGIDPATLKKYAEKYRPSHSDQFKELRIERIGAFREHISPELAEILFNEYGKTEAAPGDWLTAEKFHKIAGIDKDIIKQLAENYREDYPEWFGFYKNKSGQKAEHYHPDLLRIIKEEFKKSKAPEGWLILSHLVAKLGLHQKIIKKAAERFRLEHPEWFAVYRSGRGMREYYSPELIKLIGDRIPAAPEGWLTLSPLSRIIGTNKKALREYMKIYRTTHPEWFSNYVDGSHNAREHYSPELVRIIKEKMQKS